LEDDEYFIPININEPIRKEMERQWRAVQLRMELANLRALAQRSGMISEEYDRRVHDIKIRFGPRDAQEKLDQTLRNRAVLMQNEKVMIEHHEKQKRMMEVAAKAKFDEELSKDPVKKAAYEAEQVKKEAARKKYEEYSADLHERQQALIQSHNRTTRMFAKIEAESKSKSRGHEDPDFVY